MAMRWTRWTGILAHAGLAALVLGTGLAGCRRSAVSEEADEPAGPPPIQTAILEDKPALDPHLHQRFTAATRAEPLPDWQPPEKTMAGQSVGKLYTAVVKSWDSIRFADDDGRLLQYHATLETDLGALEIALRADLAPNHVRNFVALAWAGYYDGLVFQRAVHEKAEGQPDLQLLEGGCPLGTGDVGCGSIGYWLKPEFNNEPHVEGTVGASHEQEADTAACRFYITLGKAPYLDRNFTVFGKVTKGLDVARKIFAQPVQNASENGERDRPEKPVVIRKVTIRATGVENAPTK
jgi:cyclophilin family peptidyl-prolyl cis-trans isomerase